jgi:hypothetical protein
MADEVEHRPGSMDITEQRKTFAGFLRAATIVIAVVVVILLLLTFRI